jgi:hypothetical protein
MLHRKDDLERARQISLDTGLAAALAASLADQLEKFGPVHCGRTQAKAPQAYDRRTRLMG